MVNKKTMSVVTVPLKTEKWQEDILQKRFELCRKIYNNMLHYEIKQLNKLQHDKRYVDARKLIDEVYKIKDAKEKQARKRTEEYKTAVKISNDILKEYGMTQYDFFAEVSKQREVYKTNISSMVARYSIARPLWSAMEKYLFGNGNMLHYKKYNTIKSLASDGTSGLTMIGEDGKTIFNREMNQKVWIRMGAPKGKNIVIPLMIDENDFYKIEMLSRKIKIIRITRKLCGSRYRYYAQMTVEEAPAIRYDKDGNIKNPVGNGKVGVYINTSSVTLALENGDIETISLQYNNKSADRIKELQRYMENSRRAMNPDNYNKDGTIKKGITIDGKKSKLRWNNSNGYNRARIELKNLYRIEAEKRMLERQIIANEIISYGSEFVVNDYPFQYAAMRKKIVNESTGQEEKHKKAGDKVGNNAPATLVTLLDSKLKSKTGTGIEKIKLQDVDYDMEDYEAYYAKKLMDWNKNEK